MAEESNENELTPLMEDNDEHSPEPLWAVSEDNESLMVVNKSSLIKEKSKQTVMMIFKKLFHHCSCSKRMQGVNSE